MAKKERDEKFEKVLRDLLRHPGNRRCVNCNSLGPQYVCTTFCTFVCITCSGIHREFTHRIKSISMANFTEEEVLALTAGGNERAKQIYFKEWDPQRHSLPDNSNLNRLRDFVKHVYEDRIYTGERSRESSTRPSMSKRRDPCDNKKLVQHIGGSKGVVEKRCTSHVERNVERTLKYYFERGNPGFKEEHYGMESTKKKSSATFEVVDDRFKDDECKNRGTFPLNFMLIRNRTTSKSDYYPSNSKTPPISPQIPSLDKNILHLQTVEDFKPNDNKGGASTLPKISPVNRPERLIVQRKNDDKDKPKLQLDVKKQPKMQENDTEENQKSNPLHVPKKNTVEFLLHELSSPWVATSLQELGEMENNETSLKNIQKKEYFSDVNEVKISNALEKKEPIQSQKPHHLFTEVQISDHLCSPEDSADETQVATNGNALSENKNSNAAVETQEKPIGNELSLELASPSAFETIAGVSPNKERKELPQDLFSACSLPPPAPFSGWPAASAVVPFANMQRSPNPFDVSYDTDRIPSTFRGELVGQQVGMCVANSQRWTHSNGDAQMNLPHQLNEGFYVPTEWNGAPSSGNPFG